MLLSNVENILLLRINYINLIFLFNQHRSKFILPHLLKVSRWLNFKELSWLFSQKWYLYTLTEF